MFDANAEVGTLIIPEENRLTNRKHWIAYNLKPAGEIVVDQGAHEALSCERGKSLLPSGLKEVRGSFGVGECVRCLDLAGTRVCPRLGQLQRPGVESDQRIAYKQD